MNTAAETTLLDAAIRALRDHGLAVNVQKQPKTVGRRQVDAWLRIAKGGAHIEYAVEIKHRVAPATLG
ncbi:MAG TPA: hypothetical protein VI565_04345, partial [Burkholderiales bacterium]|nr:hypothetical protein [Burkholderiales bacterium]